MVDRLAILLVCFLKDDDDLPLLDLHLDRVTRLTAAPATVYAAAARATPAARARLDAAGITVVDVAPTDQRGSREHAWFLDQLVDHALATDATHLCTFDVDSFPVRADWVDVVAAQLPEESGLAAVCRLENGDTQLPHPSCTFARRDFYERFHPSFSPDSDGTPGFRRFLRSTGQSADTGIRLGYALWSRGLAWGRLVRTNAVDPHYLMAGVYSDAIFHLGGTGRGKLFRRDLQGSTVHRLTRPLERLPVGHGALRRAKQAALHRLRSGTEAELAAANREEFARIRARLLVDPDGFLAELRGAV